ncbi:MAG: hypothetical protein A2583_13155 [Bdellovibrionales bacterium RIFOXYD1_FULL_53_11]|nr:MAG: hypothetical protein A2583_13155 [Bdellovibrionales bacterium RIFOXYD1_FULL_53_11]
MHYLAQICFRSRNQQVKMIRHQNKSMHPYSKQDRALKQQFTLYFPYLIQSQWKDLPVINPCSNMIWIFYGSNKRLSRHMISFQ